MSDQVLMSQLSERVGEIVTVKGWVYNVRSSGKIAFLQLRDGYGRVQAVVSPSDVATQTWEAVSRLTLESSVVVEGTVVKDERSPIGVELHAKELRVLQIAEEFPIGKKEHGPEFLLDQRHLWMRSARQEAILRVRNELEFALRSFFYERKFRLTDSPMFTPNACEGTTDLFKVDYFGTPAYLSQSGQLYLEATCAALGRTYCFGPAFRSEKSKTRRHLTEFWMLEVEASFMEFEENLRLQEEMIIFVLQWVLKHCRAELKTVERDMAKLESISAPFPRLTYDEAIEKLRSLGSDIKWGSDLGADDETVLTQQYDRPIFITHYPAHVKAFYMKPDPSNPKVALNNDLLAPEGYGEIIGGSQRIDDPNVLDQRLTEHQLPKKAFQWYMDLRRFGSVPHSGFGLGLERAVAWICGLHHIRETIPFPRLLNRLEP